jgi:hypothetical protein
VSNTAAVYSQQSRVPILARELVLDQVKVDEKQFEAIPLGHRAVHRQWLSITREVHSQNQSETMAVIYWR